MVFEDMEEGVEKKSFFFLLLCCRVGAIKRRFREVHIDRLLLENDLQLRSQF